ncbi:MAG: flagellar hook-length control protein FliK [Microthrixaceae bacterium]
MAINTVQPSQRSEPAAQPRRDSDDSFSGALQREMKNRGSDTSGADAAQARRSDAERDRTERDKTERDRMRKQSDENHAVAANSAAQQGATSTPNGEVRPSEGHDESSTAGLALGETVVEQMESSSEASAEALDETEVIGSDGSAGAESVEAALDGSATEGQTAGVASDGNVTSATGAGAEDSPDAQASAASDTAQADQAGNGSGAAETVAASTISGGNDSGSDAAPTAVFQGDSAGEEGGAASGVADAGSPDGSEVNGSEVDGSGTDGAEVAGSVRPSGSGGSKDQLVKSPSGAAVAAADGTDAVPGKAAVKASSTADVATAAHAAMSSVSNQPAPNQSAPAATSNAASVILTPSQNGGFDMSRLGEGIATRLRNGERVQSLSLELHPAELGGVRVDVRQIDGVTHLVLTPDRPAGGQRLAAAMADLRHDLERAGVDIGDLQLRQDSSGGGQDHRSGPGDGLDTSPRNGPSGPSGSVIQPPITVRRSAQLAGSQQRVAIDL